MPSGNHEIPPALDKIVEPIDIVLIKVAFGISVAVALVAAPFFLFVQFFLAPDPVRQMPFWMQLANVTGVILYAGVTVFGAFMYYRSFIPFIKLKPWYQRFAVLALLSTFWSYCGPAIGRAFWNPIYKHYGITVPPEDARERAAMERAAKRPARPHNAARPNTPKPQPVAEATAPTEEVGAATESLTPSLPEPSAPSIEAPFSTSEPSLEK